MITQKEVFETSDGKQFATLFEAEQHEFMRDLDRAIGEGYVGDGEFSVDLAITELLKNFNVTRKDDNATNI